MSALSSFSPQLVRIINFWLECLLLINFCWWECLLSISSFGSFHSQQWTLASEKFQFGQIRNALAFLCHWQPRPLCGHFVNQVLSLFPNYWCAFLQHVVLLINTNNNFHVHSFFFNGAIYSGHTMTGLALAPNRSTAKICKGYDKVTNESK